MVRHQVSAKNVVVVAEPIHLVLDPPPKRTVVLGGRASVEYDEFVRNIRVEPRLRVEEGILLITTS